MKARTSTVFSFSFVLYFTSTVLATGAPRQNQTGVHTASGQRTIWTSFVASTCQRPIARTPWNCLFFRLFSSLPFDISKQKAGRGDIQVFKACFLQKQGERSWPGSNDLSALPFPFWHKFYCVHNSLFFFFLARTTYIERQGERPHCLRWKQTVLRPCKLRCPPASHWRWRTRSAWQLRSRSQDLLSSTKSKRCLYRHCSWTSVGSVGWSSR